MDDVADIGPSDANRDGFVDAHCDGPSRWVVDDSQGWSDRLVTTWSQDSKHLPVAKRQRYDGTVKDDTLPTETTGDRQDEWTPAGDPVLTSWKDDPMWSAIGIDLYPRRGAGTLLEDELRLRIEMNREAAIRRRAAKQVAEAVTAEGARNEDPGGQVTAEPPSKSDIRLAAETAVAEATERSEATRSLGACTPSAD